MIIIMNMGTLINTMGKKKRTKNRLSSADNQRGIGYRTVVLTDPSNHPQSSLGIP